MGILANNDGKILRSSSSGKVLKQNYNFGGYVNSQNYTIQIPTLSDYNFNDGFSVLNFRKDGSLSPDIRPGIFNITVDSLNQNSISFGHDYQYGNHSVVTYKNGNSQSINRADRVNMMFFYSQPNLPKCEILNSLTTFNRSSFSDPDIEQLDLSVLGKSIEIGYGYGRAGMVGYDRSRRGMFLIYGRDLSENELRYLYNNELGNEPLSSNLLLVYYKYLQAEIFDFGGAIEQAVGVRDYSGNNNHGLIMNLPAGTLQEQLDYANTNLFEVW